jgi:hypothetical protein
MAQSKPMGRPTKYCAALQQKAEDYCQNYEKHGDVVPTLEGLCDHLDIVKDTLYRWKEDIEDFSYVVEKILRRQCRGLINKGLKGEFNSPITKLLLSKHGYREATQIDSVSTDGSMTPKSIERIIVQAENI